MVLFVLEMSSPSPGRAAVLDALVRVIDGRGIDRATVREVAGAAGVAIGTVQHHFPTKDDMLTAAFEEVVRRVTSRVAGAELGGDVHGNLRTVLHELLPLDARRLSEARVHLAFSSRASTSPALARVQQRVLASVQEQLRSAFALVWVGAEQADRCAQAAEAALALVDGLTLHSVSSGSDPGLAGMQDVLDLFLDAVLGRPPP